MKNAKPFFSIVTEVYNRELTIVKTITSVINQNFFDYEYIIVDSNSSDNSASLIRETLRIHNKNNIFFFEDSSEENEIKRWNRPLYHATGIYIVGLEGDDWFDSGYLKRAHEVLKYEKNGIYVGYKNESPASKRLIGQVANNKVLRAFKKLNFCPPPSEVIFKRTHNSKSYYYDENFLWAAEYSLYEKILLDGYDVFFEYINKNNAVHRGISYRKFGFKHIHDALIIFNKYVDELHGNDRIVLIDNILIRFSNILSSQIYQHNFEPLLFKNYLKMLWKYKRFNSLKNLIFRLFYILPRQVIKNSYEKIFIF